MRRDLRGRACARRLPGTLERAWATMRVLVTGASGSGTTTLGRALSRELEVAFFDVDDYFWVPTEPPYQQQRDSSTRLSLLVSDLAKASQSVTAGSVINWGGDLEDSFSLIVFLTLRPDLRLARLNAREIGRFGRADSKFLQWAAQYDEGSVEVNSLKGDERWLTKRTCPVLRIEGDVSVAERVSRVAKALSNLHLRPTDSAAAEVRR
jgi:adenylate kinase family enzyme